MFFTEKQTAIAGFTYNFNPKMAVSFAGGIGASKPYGAFSFRQTGKLYEIDAEYIAASLHFSRLFVSNPQFTEPQRENIRGVYRPFRWLFLSGSHMYSTDPYADVPVLARIDSGTTGFYVWKAHATANAYHSTSAGVPTNGLSFTAGRSIVRWLDLDADWFRSDTAEFPRSTSHIGDLRFTENFKQSFTFTQYLTRSNGQNSILFGGTYNGKGYFISATNNVVFVPFPVKGQQAGFQRIYSISLSVPLPHTSRADFNTDIEPDGQVRYTASGTTTFYRYEGLEPGTVPRFVIGDFLIAGRVIDEKGQPVEGAVVRVGKDEAISDRMGRFELRSDKKRTDSLSVLVNDFVSSFDYAVVRAPLKATFVPDDGKVAETTIEVRRLTEVTTNAAPETIVAR